jgi:transposase
MDWLLEIEPQLSEAVYRAVADLLNLEVDPLVFDTTSTYFQPDQADPGGEPTAHDSFRTYGKSKDHRPDLPQVVIGLAVTRRGSPSESGPGPATPTTQPSSARSRTISGSGS